MSQRNFSKFGLFQSAHPGTVHPLPFRLGVYSICWGWFSVHPSSNLCNGVVFLSNNLHIRHVSYLHMSWAIWNIKTNCILTDIRRSICVDNRLVLHGRLANTDEMHEVLWFLVESVTSPNGQHYQWDSWLIPWFPSANMQKSWQKGGGVPFSGGSMTSLQADLFDNYITAVVVQWEETQWVDPLYAWIGFFLPHFLPDRVSSYLLKTENYPGDRPYPKGNMGKNYFKFWLRGIQKVSRSIKCRKYPRSQLQKWLRLEACPPTEFFVLFETRSRQESPPAWTQEAYRPPHSKCLLCCSVSWWGGGGGGRGTHIQSWWGGGYPQPVLRGYLHPVLMGGTPIKSWWGGIPLSARWCTPYPHWGVDWQTENSTFPILQMQVVARKSSCMTIRGVPPAV